jgi:hypothetical protein
MAMTDQQRAAVRELLERMSQTVERHPDLNAPALRARAGLKRRDGDMALDLLVRGGFVERRRVNAEDVYTSTRPYRVSNEAPKAAFAKTHAAQQGGG